MKLALGLEYKDLYSIDGLHRIDKLFLDFLKRESSSLYNVFIETRAKKIESFNSEQLISFSEILEKFIGKIFSIENDIVSYHRKREFSNHLYEVKRNFIHRTAIQKYKKEDINPERANKDFIKLAENLENKEANNDEFFISILGKTQKASEEYEILARYAASRIYFGPASPLFSKPNKIDFNNLINFTKNGYLLELANIKSKPIPYLEANYCINCHKTGKDSCSTGMKEKDTYKTNLLGNLLSGCPLQIKISEMNEVFSKGNLISALSIITCNNPMVALTGKRICNDCSKACIYQKQDPVDIPSIESRILEDVLELPYGFEIYSLLTFWQPLKPLEYLPEKSTGSKILIVGMGPSGIALSHYLQRSGSHVVAIDALKIELLPAHLIINPIKNISDLKDAYYKIKPQGFGGVAEYGITDRWDKFNLLVSRLLLEKRQNFELYGGVKFGANITYEQAKKLGFDYIALCCGSGYPKAPLLENMSAGNIRVASDFLMSLGSGGADLDDSNTKFLIHLPAIVVGAGLTAVDAAVEITKYYPFLAKKIYRKLQDKSLSFFTEAEKEQTEILISHGKKYCEEDIKAKSENRAPDYKQLNNDFGGITILYRKDIKESPSYRINHEELQDALCHWVKVLENTELISIEVDSYSNCSGVIVKQNNSDEKTLKAKTILFATGTSPLTQEDASGIGDNKSDMMIFGDMDSSYSGSVVKAIASARDNYRKILDALSVKGKEKSSHNEYFTSTVIENISHSDEIFELKIRSKFAAENFHPGQFFKLQNFHIDKEKSFEPIALTGAFVTDDIISLITQIVGDSSRKASLLRQGDRVSLMGPCGEPSFVPLNSTILLIGGGVGNAALFPYAKELKKNGNKVIFLAAYRKKSHLLYPDVIKKFSDEVIFTCDEEKIEIEAGTSIKGSVIDGLNLLDFSNIKNIFVVGSANMMNVVAEFISKNNISCSSKASINAPMQCMLGGVCGQCLIQDSDNSPIFICKNQDQKLNSLIMQRLNVRLSQNSLLEKI